MDEVPGSFGTIFAAGGCMAGSETVRVSDMGEENGLMKPFLYSSRTVSRS